MTDFHLDQIARLQGVGAERGGYLVSLPPRADRLYRLILFVAANPDGLRTEAARIFFHGGSLGLRDCRRLFPIWQARRLLRLRPTAKGTPDLDHGDSYGGHRRKEQHSALEIG